MKPLFLQLKAFGPFSDSVHVSFEHVFDGGLFLIHGRTGAGKTSLLDGLCFSLFGRPSSEEREKDLRALRSDLASTDTMTETELIFSIGEIAYRVHRIPTQMTPKKRGEGLTEYKGSAELFRLGSSIEDLRETLKTKGPAAIASLTWIPLAGKVEAVDEAIEELVGMNERQFRQVVILPQGRFREFLSSTSTERQAILEKLFQTDRFSRLQQYIASQARGAEAKLREGGQHLQAKLASLGLHSVEDICSRKADLATQLETATTQLHEARVQAEQLARDLNRAKELETAQARRQTLVAESAILKQRETEIEGLREQLAAGRAWMPYFQLDDLANSLSTKLADLDRKRQQADQRRHELEIKQTESKKRHATLMTMKPSMDEMTVERNRLRDIIRPLGEIGTAQKQLQTGRSQIETAQRSIDGLAVQKLTYETQQAQLIETLFAIDNTLQGVEAETLETEDRRVRELELRYHHSEASRLAQSLSPGSPCPVCGSLEHPAPAQPKAEKTKETTTAPSAESIAHERSAFEKRRVEIAERRSARQTRLEPLHPLRADRSVPAKLETESLSFANAFTNYERVQQALLETRKTIDVQTAELRARMEANQQLEHDIARRLAEIPEADRDYNAIMKRGLELKTLQESREKTIKETEAELQTLASDHAGVSGTLTALQDEITRLNEERGELASRLKTLAGSIQSAQPKVRLTESALAKMATDIESHAQAVTKNQAARQEIEQIVAKNLEQLKSDRSQSELASELSKATDSRTEFERRHARLSVDLENLVKFEADALKSSEKLSVLRAEAERAVRMSGLLTGDKSQNKMLVPLSRFVLQSRFEEVLEQANRRLGRMSRGQFQLRRPALSRNLRDSQGLELSVEDSVAGKERHAGSLSGGESFMAALSLALGLADVVQADLGGIKLDSVLIDEGFGTLDAEALDLAMKTLVDLQAGGRIVGIISHVQELKNQVHHQLEVSKSVRGSHVDWNVSI